MFAEQFFNDWIHFVLWLEKGCELSRNACTTVPGCGCDGGILKIHAHSKSVAYFRAPQGPFATRSNEHIQKFHSSACCDDDASLLLPLLPLQAATPTPEGTEGLRLQRLRCNLESHSPRVCDRLRLSVCPVWTVSLSVCLALNAAIVVVVVLGVRGGHCKSPRRKTIESESVICNCLRHTERPTSLLRMHSPNPETATKPATGAQVQQRA